MTGLLNQAARDAAKLASMLDQVPGFDDTMENIFTVEEEKTLSPLKAYHLILSAAPGENELRKNEFLQTLLPEPGTEEYVKDKDGKPVLTADGTPAKRNRWDKFKRPEVNSKGNTIMVPASFYKDAFLDTRLARRYMEELTWLRDDKWDTEGSPFTAMTNSGDRTKRRRKLNQRLVSGARNMRKAGEMFFRFWHFAEHVKAVRVFLVKKQDGTYEMDAECIRVVDYSAPEQGSMGNVKYYTIEAFLDIDLEGLTAASDKWAFLTKPKTRKPRAPGQNETDTNKNKGVGAPAIKDIKGAADYINEVATYIGDPADTGADSFYHRAKKLIETDTGDDFLLNLDTIYEGLDGLVSEYEGKIKEIKAKRRKAENPKAEQQKAA